MKTCKLMSPSLVLLLNIIHIYGKESTFCFPLILDLNMYTYQHHDTSQEIVLKCSNNGTIKIKEMKYSIPLKDNKFCSGCDDYHCSICPCCVLPPKLCYNTIKIIPTEVKDKCLQSTGECSFNIYRTVIDTTDPSCDGINYHHNCEVYKGVNLCASRWLHIDYECDGVDSRETSDSFNIPSGAFIENICGTATSVPASTTTTLASLNTTDVKEQSIGKFVYTVIVVVVTIVCIVAICLAVHAGFKIRKRFNSGHKKENEATEHLTNYNQ